MALRCTRREMLRRSVYTLAALGLWGQVGPCTASTASVARATHPLPTPATAGFSMAPRVKVIGVGGAGGKAVTRMVERGIAGVEFCVVDCNVTPALYLPGAQCLRIGPAVARGLGSGGVLALGAACARESEAEPRAALTGADMVLLVAALGGGTGGGAGPLIARWAKEAGACTVALVTTPFAFERPRLPKAEEGLAGMQAAADAVIAVPSAGLLPAYGQKSIMQAFGALDALMERTARSLVEIMTVPGLISADPADVRHVLGYGGLARLGCGVAGGAGAGLRAAEDALASPFLCLPAGNVQSALVCVRSGTQVTVADALAAAGAVSRAVDPLATVYMGATVDAALPGDRVEVTLFASGTNGD